MATDIQRADPDGEAARAMRAALWAEIQTRYGFRADDPFDPADAAGPGGGFWIALDDGDPVGSVALLPLGDGGGELDVMYVAPTHRRRGVAAALLTALEVHARSAGTTRLLLRAGDPQPEALAFYRTSGFGPIEPFGRWANDESALCFRKTLQ